MSDPNTVVVAGGYVVAEAQNNVEVVVASEQGPAGPGGATGGLLIGGGSGSGVALDATMRIVYDFAGTATKLRLSTAAVGIDALQMTLGLAAPSWAEGLIYWDDTDGTLAICTDVTDVTLQTGQEQHMRVVNKTGVALSNGDVVAVDGAQGQRPKAVLADADDATHTEAILAVVTADIANNQEGYVTTFGLVRDINTTGGGESWSDGDVIYLSSTAGSLTNIEPDAPVNKVSVGVVLYAHASAGILFIRPDHHPTIDELSDVLITAVADGEYLTWDDANSRWKNSALALAGHLKLGAALDGTLRQVLDFADTGSPLYLASDEVKVEAQNAVDIGLLIKGAAAQSASLLELQDSAGNVVLSASADGSELMYSDTANAWNMFEVDCTTGKELRMNYSLGMGITISERGVMVLCGTYGKIGFSSGVNADEGAVAWNSDLHDSGSAYYLDVITGGGIRLPGGDGTDPALLIGSNGNGLYELDSNTISMLGDLIVEEGTASFALPEVDGSSDATLTALQCNGSVVTNLGQSGVVTLTLPAAAAGLNLIVTIGTAIASALHVKAGASDKLYLDGTALDDGDKATLATPAIGDTLTLFAFKTAGPAYDWVAVSGNTTWTDGGA